MSRLISKTSSALCLMPPNYMSCLIFSSFSSLLVTLIFKLSVQFSPCAFTTAIAVGDSSHFGVHASCVLFPPCRISSCIRSMPSSCPYRLISTPCPVIFGHLWSPIASMISWSSCLIILHTSSRLCGSSKLLMLAGTIGPLRFPLSLYISR